MAAVPHRPVVLQRTPHHPALCERRHDHIFWNENLQGSTITSKWYPWGNNFVRHNGRFEGIDSTINDCLFFFGWTCIIENHPMLHVHEHADGGFTYNSRRF
jgi:hypothetical protein